MKTIWKYTLSLATPPQTLHLPACKLLSVQFQEERLTAWFEVNSSSQYESREYTVYGTGWSMPDDPGEHVATVQLGAFVWHVYERRIDA